MEKNKESVAEKFEHEQFQQIVDRQIQEDTEKFIKKHGNRKYSKEMLKRNGYMEKKEPDWNKLA